MKGTGPPSAWGMKFEPSNCLLGRYLESIVPQLVINLEDVAVAASDLETTKRAIVSQDLRSSGLAVAS